MSSQGSSVLPMDGKLTMLPSALPGLKYQRKKTVIIFAEAKGDLKPTRPPSHTNLPDFRKVIGTYRSPSAHSRATNSSSSFITPSIYERPLSGLPAANGGYLGGRRFKQETNWKSASKPCPKSARSGLHPSCSKCTHTDLPTLAVLRSIAPHVAGRWREVAQDLGLSYEDVLNMEKQNPMSKASELASRALELSWKRGSVSQGLLVQVLSDHKLLAAIAIVSNRGISGSESAETATPVTPYRLSSRPSTASVLSRPGTSSGVYICTSNSGKPTVKHLLPRRDPISNSITASDSRLSTPDLVTIRRSTVLVQNTKDSPLTNAVTNSVNPSARPTTAQVIRSNPQIKGRLLVRIFIERVEPENTQAKRLQLQRALLRHESSIVSLLSTIANLSQIQIHHKWTGIITVIMSYSDPLEISVLTAKEKEPDGPLKSALRSILTDKAVLAEADTTEIQIRMEIFNDTRTEVADHDTHHTFSGSITRICTQQMIAGRREEAIPQTPKPRTKMPTASEQVLKTLEPIKKKIQEELKLIRTEYKLFQRNIFEFLMALKATKPSDMSSISSQADLLRCYINSKNISSTRRQINAGRLQEYISLLDSIAEFCDEIHKDFLHWQSDSNTEGIGEKELLLPLADKLNNMLDPTFNFSANQAENMLVLSAEDKTQFSGLINFIPEVINHLDELLQIISIQIDTRQRQFFHVDNNHI